MTPRDELIKAMATAILKAWGAECTDCSADYLEGCGCARSAGMAAVSTLETFLTARDWKITGPEATDKMKTAADKSDLETSRNHLGGHPQGAQHWFVMHAAAPNLLENADAG